MKPGASEAPYKSKVMNNFEVSTVTVSNKAIAFGSNKAGDGVTIVSQKRLGELTGLKGAALKRAHFQYRLDAGKALNAGLSSGMASGDILAKSVVPTKNGGLRAVFDRVANLNAPAEKSSKVTALEAEVARLKAELAAKTLSESEKAELQAELAA